MCTGSHGDVTFHSQHDVVSLGLVLLSIKAANGHAHVGDFFFANEAFFPQHILNHVIYKRTSQMLNLMHRC